MPKKKPEEPTLRGYYAGFASRLMAFIIDILILAVALAVLGILWFFVFTIVTYVWDWISGNQETREIISIAMVVLVTVTTFATYFIFLWTILGTTFGGLVMGTIVVNKKGKKPTFLQAVIRFLAEFGIPFFFIFGSLWIPFSRSRRALYDRIAGTFVIYNWDAKPDELFLKQAADQLTEVGKIKEAE